MIGNDKHQGLSLVVLIAAGIVATVNGVDLVQWVADGALWALAHPLAFFVSVALQYAVLMSGQVYLRKLPIFGYWLFWVFILQDWLLDKLLTPVFLGRLRSLGQLVTGRMQIYIRDYRNKTGLSRREQWRYWFARVLCKYLSKFDPDPRGHCRERVL